MTAFVALPGLPVALREVAVLPARVSHKLGFVRHSKLWLWVCLTSQLVPKQTGSYPPILLGRSASAMSASPGVANKAECPGWAHSRRAVGPFCTAAFLAPPP